MSINTSWNTVKKPHGNLNFNVNVGTTANPDFYPLVINVDLPRYTADGDGPDQIQIVKNVGTSRSTPFDFSTVQGLKDVHTALPAWARGAFKEAVVAAINEDPGI